MQLSVLGDELLDLLERAHVRQHLDVGVRDAELGGRGASQGLGGKPHRVADDVDGGQRRGVLMHDELALHGRPPYRRCLAGMEKGWQAVSAAAP